MTERRKRSSWGAPNPKVQAAGAAGAATTLIVWVLGLFGISMPPEAAAAVTTLFAFLAGYIVPATDRYDE